MEAWLDQSALIDKGVGLLEALFQVLLVLVLAGVACWLIKRTLPKAIQATAERTRQREQGDPEEFAKRYETLASVAGKTAIITVWAITGFIVLSQVGIDIAPILASAGVVGIAVGFGAQTLVRDVISGTFVILENQYRQGDVVRVAGISGLVEEVNLRRSVLRDLDGTVHHVPNGEIRVASNLTREWSRVNFDVSVGYGEDLDRVMAVINDVGQDLAADPDFGPLIVDPPSALRVDNFGDSGVTVKILGVTKPIKQWDVMGEMRRRLKRAFDEEGIEIPFPHRVVYIRRNGDQQDATAGDTFS